MDRRERFREEFIGLYSEIDLRSLLDKIAEKIKYYLDCAESSIFLYNPIHEELYFEVVTGEKQEALKQIVLKRGQGVVGWIAEHGRALIVNDTSNDPRFSSLTDSQTHFKTRSLMGVPVRMERQLLGVLEAINKNRGSFDEEDRQVLEYISQLIAIPLQNAMLFKKVTQETQEKARLIELAKAISGPTRLEEVFDVLRHTITEVIRPLEISVMVQSEERMYHLVSNRQTAENAEALRTRVGDRVAVFPLRTSNRNLGFLEIETEHRIPEEVASLIKGIAVFAAISIEKSELIAAMIEKERMDKEIQIARDIQQSFLLQEELDLPGIEVAFVNLPSSEVGGDYYEIIALDAGKTVFGVNDISGHGVPASLLMSIFRANFVYRCKKDRNLYTTLNHLNNLIAETTDPNLYVTSFTALLDHDAHRLEYVNAGHIPPFVVRGEEILDLHEGSLVLGMFPDVEHRTMDFQLQTGDLLTLFTDGIVEAENAAGEAFSLDRLKEWVRGRRDRPLAELKTALIESLSDFTGRPEFEDDVTFMFVRVNDLA